MNGDDEVVGFRWPDGEQATDDQIRAEAVTWAQSFGHHVFALKNANQTHGCTSSCFKKSKPTKKAQKATKVQRCRFDFDRIVTLTDPETGKTRRILRRGKKLVPEAFVQATNERNEYGRILPLRSRPHISSSNDVTEACVQCNADYQFQPRFPPEDVLTAASAAWLSNHSDITLIFGRKKLTAKQRCILRLFGVAMRSSHIADFYATKYLAKPQQTLVSGLGAIVYGLQRMEARDAATKSPQPDDVAAKAMRVMRSAVFAIQKCYWNSACECTTFIKTTSTAIFTEREVVLFMSRAFAMLHECKRLLNKKTPCRGILFVRDPGDAPMPLDAALRVASADSEADVAQRPPELGSEGAEQEVPAGDEPDEGALPAGGLFNPAEDGESDINSDMGADDAESAGGDAAEPAAAQGASDVDDGGKPGEDEEQERAADAPAAAAEPTLLTFQPSEVKNIIDDWLHRGEALHDIDLYWYARYIERVRRPSDHSALATIRLRFGRVFLFDEHYDLSSHYMQIRRKRPHRVRIVGPNCPRVSVNDGEDNASYKSLFFSIVRCSGEGECCAPTNFRSLLFPRLDLPLAQADCKHGSASDRSCRSCADTVLQSTCAEQWRARATRTFKVLAPRATAKLKSARRIATLADTTLFKGTKGATGGDPYEVDEEGALARDGRLKHCLIFKMVANARRRVAVNEGLHFDDCDAAVERIQRFLDLPAAGHEDQLSLAEFCAYMSRRVLVHLDMSVESRNFAQRDAAAKAKDLEADYEKHPNNRENFQYDNPFGDATEEADVPELEREDPLKATACDRVASLDVAVALLTRRAEIEGDGKRHRQRQMREAHRAFEASLTDYRSPYPMRQHEQERPDGDVEKLLGHQSDAAAALLMEHDLHEEAVDPQEAGAAEHGGDAAQEAFVETVPEVDGDLVAHGP
ncbi:MAG: hypothetical protein QF749_13805, partial [Verrucomicrobiota bacterium]|nr:hypothetical protein [Verrucomicrobiota bacterium]